MSEASVLGGLAQGLREQILEEYNEIVQRFVEGRWLPSELHAGRFCQVVFAIINDFATGKASTKASRKPRDFVSACRSLESNILIPESLRLHVLKFLPVLYDIRNRRGVGHIGGDVDPNYMDATLCTHGASWILGELVRYFHNVSIDAAQTIVNNLTSVQYPLVWVGGNIRRVLDPSIKQADQILLLLASAKDPVGEQSLLGWLEITKRSNLTRVLKSLHQARFIEAANPASGIHLLPPGARRVHELTRQRTGNFRRAA